MTSAKKLNTLMTGAKNQQVDAAAELRAKLRAENEAISNGTDTIPSGERITLAQAFERFVYMTYGSQVFDLHHPKHLMTLSDFHATYGGSLEEVQEPSRTSANGTITTPPPRMKPVTKLWMDAGPLRLTVYSLTFKAGAPLTLHDPNGAIAVNLWQPNLRSKTLPKNYMKYIKIFEQHVAFLFGDDTDRFLNWLAHVEQYPGELPQTGWLHIAKQQGIGRNWLASVLVRVWAGCVAPNLDIVQIFDSGFNGQLAHRYLAIVDEIREGGCQQWKHAEKLKSFITEEFRTLNPKYGRSYSEFNACRLLMFSNHISAVPLSYGERRINVSYTNAAPKSSAHYGELFSLLKNPQFIASVAAYLSTRDISKFNAGAHAELNDAKREVMRASQTEEALICQRLLKHWPSALITTAHLRALFGGSDFGTTFTTSQRHTLEEAGIRPLKKLVKVGKKPTRLWVLKDLNKWEGAGGNRIEMELKKVIFTGTVSDYLEELECED